MPGRKKADPLKQLKKDLAYGVLPIFPPIGRFWIRSLASTVKTTFSNDGAVRAMLAGGQPFVLAFLHGRQFLLVNELEGWPMVIMTSISYLGEIQSRILKSYGYETIQGSRSRGGSRVLAEMTRRVRGGKCGAFAVDGPRGPYGVVKPGALFVASKLGVPLVPVTTSAYPSRVFTSEWDRYLLPMPFSKGVVRFGEPLYFQPGMTGEEIESTCGDIARELEKLTEEADGMVGRYRGEEGKR